MLSLGAQVRGSVTLDTIARWKPLGVEAAELGVESEPTEIQLKRDWFESHGLEPVTHLGTQLVHPHARQMDAIAEKAIENLRLSKHLGASIVLCAAGGHPFLQPSAVVRLTVETLRSIEGVARELGLHIALENHGDLTVEEVLEVMVAVDSPNVGTNVDVANSYQTGDTPVETARLLAPHMFYAHVKGIALKEGVFKIRPLGEGIFDWDEILPIFKDAKRDAILAMEMGFYEDPSKVEEVIVQSLNWIRPRL